LKRKLRERIGRFKDLIYSDGPLARQALRKLLKELIRFIPTRQEG